MSVNVAEKKVVDNSWLDDDGLGRKRFPQVEASHFSFSGRYARLFN